MPAPGLSLIHIFAKAYADEHGDALMNVSEEERRSALVAFALPKNIAKMKRDMAKYRVEYDEWFSETTLHESGAIRDVIEALQKNGLIYEKDGATWYKACLLYTSGTGLHAQRQCFFRVIKFGAFENLLGFDIFLAVFHV